MSIYKQEDAIYSMRNTIGLNLLVGALYFILSKIILNLPATGGAAYYLWPATGLALAGLLSFGRRVLIGIFLGAFLVNLRFLNMFLSQETYDMLLNSFLISFGSILNPYIANIILKILGLRIKRLQDYREIFGIFVIGGILGSIITATIGSLSLYYNKVIGFESFIDNWIAWWIGDALGVFLFFPVFYQVFNFKLYKKRRIFLIIIPIIAGVLLSSIYHFKISSTKTKLNQVRLQEKSIRIFNRLVADIENKKTILQSVKAFFESSDNITRDDFYNFTNVFLAKTPEINGIMWAPKIEKRDFKNIDKSFMNIYNKSLKEINKREISLDKSVIYPILYAEPFYQMVDHVGLDVSSVFSSQNLNFSFSQRDDFLITFEVIEDSDKSGTLSRILLPVFNNSTQLLTGYVFTVVNINKLIENIIEKLKFRNISLDLYKKSSLTGSDKSLLLSSLKNLENKADLPSSVHFLEVGDNILEFVFHENYLEENNSNPIEENVFIILSLFFTSVVGVILLLIVGQKETIAHVVDIRTADLQNSKIDVERAANKLKELASFKGQFLQVISADMKRLLKEMGQNFEHIELHKNDLEFKNNLKMIKNHHSIMDQILDDVIYYSEVDSGDFKLNFTNFNFHDLLSRIIERYAPQATAKALRLTLSMTGNCPEFIYSDKERLAVVFNHLIENAIEYTNIGTVEILVSAQELQNHMSFISVSIRDTGIGIAEADLPHIFNLSSTIKLKKGQNHSSSGLGLVISAKLLKYLGSEISASSVLNKGSEFNFSFTAKIVSSLSSKDFAEDDYTQFANLNVLFCEDNQINQKVITAIAKKLKLNYEFASNGKEAIITASKKKLDVIFMDINMPNINGFEATKAIRENKMNEHTPIVALTLNVFEETRQKTIEIGMCDFIEKPIRTIEIIRVLKNIVDKKYTNY